MINGSKWKIGKIQENEADVSRKEKIRWDSRFWYATRESQNIDQYYKANKKKIIIIPDWIWQKIIHRTHTEKKEANYLRTVVH